LGLGCNYSSIQKGGLIMRSFIKILFSAIFIILFTNCANDDIADSNNSFVNAQVDLIGFSDSYVELYFNGTEHYHAYLSNVEPFAGPQASFTTKLLKGINEMNAKWSINSTSHNHISNITIGDSEQYYLSIIKTSNDSLIVNIQDKPFDYL
jgi:hypothetical protein